MDLALTKVKEILSSNAVVVFSKTYCGYCKKAKKLLQELGATYKLLELDEESGGEAMMLALVQMTGQRTVPNVFISGKHIGGCDNVSFMHKEGKLVPLLSIAGAIAESSA